MDPFRVRLTGPLARHRESLWAELLAQGYTPLSSGNLLRVMAHLSRWLDATGLDPGDLTEPRIDEFLAHRRAAGYTGWRTRRGLQPIVDHLHRVAEVPAAAAREVASTPLDRRLQGYAHYLAQERALVPSTLRGYLEVARRFLSERLGGAACEVDHLRPADVTAFVVREAGRWRIGTAKNTVTALRSLLRYLYLQGALPVDLVAAVPAVAGYRLSGLPKALEAEQVERLLGHTDPRTAIGRRDYAVLLLMVRLGLRAGEVATLALDDVSWAEGALTVCGKGLRQERLPLPHDVGAALAAYLRGARPSTTCRRVFIRTRAPFRGLGSTAIKAIVRSAGQRIGLRCLGSHCLRHTAATRMLGHGTSLSEIAQVLRHQSLGTTAIYAKVDRDALRPLCRPWPGARS